MEICLRVRCPGFKEAGLANLYLWHANAWVCVWIGTTASSEIRAKQLIQVVLVGNVENLAPRAPRDKDDPTKEHRP